MLKIAIICFSLTGEITAGEILDYLQKEGHDVLLARKSKYLADSISVKLSQWTEQQFQQQDAIIFVGACGIAVRSIAPYIQKKTNDPAVIVVDECKRHVISLLSGHIGGANELTLHISQAIGADPVITTATDLHQQFAVDVFAVKNNCAMINMTAAKYVSADLLSGKKVGVYCEFPIEGELPSQLLLCNELGEPITFSQDMKNMKRQENACDKVEKCDQLSQKAIRLETGISMTTRKGVKPFQNTVTLIPRILTMGIGCKKDTDEAVIIREIQERLLDEKYYAEAFQKIASIDLKKHEPGILSLSEKLKIPFETFTSDELMSIEGEFTESAFVKSITGVSNVCERSAVMASDHGRLLEKKLGKNGVTTAVACADWRIHFE